MKDSNIDAKLDAPLQMKLRETSKSLTDKPLQCFVKFNQPIAGDQKKKLEEAGVRIISVVKEIATVEASAESIQRVARYDFVHSISLSQQRYPQKK